MAQQQASSTVTLVQHGGAGVQKIKVTADTSIADLLAANLNGDFEEMTIRVTSKDGGTFTVENEEEAAKLPAQEANRVTAVPDRIGGGSAS